MRTGFVAIGLAAFVGAVPASFAQAPPVLAQGKSAGTGIEAGRRALEISDALRLEDPEHAGVFVDAPIGRIWVGPELLDGEPSYVRRTKGKEGMLIVEVSTTPFMDGPAGVELIGRSDQPAGW
jgi:hypothetical protein